MFYNTRAITAALSLLAFLGIGILVSVESGNSLRENAEREWAAKARLDAARLSDGVLFWISKAEVNLRAMAGLFQDLGNLSPERFFKLVEEAEAWDPEISFDTVVYARRVLKSERDAFEADLGFQMLDARDPAAVSAVRFESFGVTHSSDPDGPLKLGIDLASHPEMRTVVTAARQLPGNVILGPAFKGRDDKTFALLATASDLGGGDGVMAATVNLHDFFDTLGQSQLPSGITVRLVERDSEAGEQLVTKPIIGPAEPRPGVALTEIVNITKGQAKWSLNWDVDPTYLGGPPEDAVKLTQFGGSLVTLLVTMMLGYLVVENVRFHKLVNDKTAQLSQNSMIVQLTMDSIDQGFAVWNADQRLVVWSKKCDDFWYHPGAKLRTGMHMRELLEHLRDSGAFGEDLENVDIEHELNRIIASGTNSDDTFPMTDGRKVHVRRFPLERGGYVSVYTDVTEQSQQSDELKLQRENAIKANLSKTDFVTKLSHEMRDPLNSIIGFTDILLSERNEDVNDRARDTLSLVNQSGKHLLELISATLDLSKIEAGVVELQKTQFPVKDFLEDIAAMMSIRAEEHNSRIVIDNSLKPGAQLSADQTRLRQVFINLVGNSIKFTENGTIKLSAEYEGAGIVFRIEDTGDGIPPEDLPTITEPFKQARTNEPDKHGGTGLGLTIAKSIANLHEAEFTVESIRGQGTTVSVSFPG